MLNKAKKYAWEKKELEGSFNELLEVIQMLRHPEKGCPWDLEQTHLSLRTYLIEECFEAIDAIDNEDANNLSEELGDVLLQVVLHAQIAKENNSFDIKDIVRQITKKMIDRHPHVFDTLKVSNSSEVLENWEKNKKQMGSSDTTFADVLEKLPKSAPSLLISERIGEKSARNNFDWENFSDVLGKLKEEYSELLSAIESANILGEQKPLAQKALEPQAKEHIAEEIGDMMFTLSQVARWIGVSGEDCLRQSNKKFIRRIRAAEETLGKSFSEASSTEKEDAWNEAKRKLSSKE